MPSVLRAALALVAVFLTPLIASAQAGGAQPPPGLHQGTAAIFCVIVLLMAFVLWTVAARRRDRMGV